MNSEPDIIPIINPIVAQWQADSSEAERSTDNREDGISKFPPPIQI